jgi:putative ABC transport system permease protein
LRPSVPVTFAAAALSAHGLRTLLCLTGVAIGVTAVLLLTGLGEGARRYVDAQFESLGSNLVFVFPGHTDTEGAMPGVGGAPNDLTLQDARALLRGVRGVERVVPVVVGTETVSHGGRDRQVRVVGATAGFLPARRLWVAGGRNLPDLEWERGAPVTLLGSRLARELFPGTSPIGEHVRVGDRRLRVVGIIGGEGHQLGLDVTDMALVPVGSARALFDRDGLDRLLVEGAGAARVEEVVGRLREVLLERHGEEDFTLVTQDSVAGSLGSILRTLTLALAGIAAVSLGVAGVGIMNVMLVSVAERTAEVGLLRALGARRGEVRALFLAEAALISLAGGAVGLLLAFGGARLLGGLYPDLDATPPGWAVAAALGVSLAVGLVFGVLPANRATRLDPVAALRG